MDAPNSRSHLDLVILMIVLVAFGLRTGWPTLAEFKYDEANVVRHALQIARKGRLPVVGVGSSTGVKNLPLMLYLIALPLRFWADPVAAVLFTGWLNSLAVAATYRLGKTYLDLTTGRVAAGLFAVGGWAVLYGRKVWCRTLPIFTLAFIAALMAAFVKGKRWALVGAFAALAGLIGLQLEGLIFGPILALTLLLFHRDVGWRPLLVATGVFALLMAPYGIHDALHGWQNARGLLQYAGGESTFTWNGLRYAFRLIGSAGIEGMAGVFAGDYLAALPELWWLNDLMSGLLVLALMYALLQLITGGKSRRRVTAILLLWFTVPVLSQLRTSSPTQPHYFVLLYPVQFLFIGMLLSDGLRRLRRRPWRRLVGAAGALGLLLWSGWQISNIAALFPMMITHPTTGGYGIPLRYTRAAAVLVDKLDCTGEVIVLSHGTTPAFEETPAVFDALLFKRPRRFVDGQLALPFPNTDATAYLIGPIAPEDSPFAPMMEQLDELESTTSTTLTLPDGWRYRSYCRQQRDREDVLTGLTRFPVDVPFDNNVIFAAYALPDTTWPDRTVDIWLAWWLRERPTTPNATQFYAHLRDANGTTVAQFDGNGYPVSQWQAGDLVLSRFPISVPETALPGEYHVRVGMYTLPDVANVPVVDAAGAPMDDGVTLGNLTVNDSP